MSFDFLPRADELPPPDLTKPTRLKRDAQSYDDKLAKNKSKREREKVERAAWLKLREQVYIRDGGICRATGKPLELWDANPYRQMHPHHIKFRSAGGEDTTANVITLDPKIHDEIHAHRLECSGNGNGVVTFTRRNRETGAIERTWLSEPRGKK
jgi:hypothetical protein